VRYSMIATAALGLLAASGASAATFAFNTDPFGGSDALTTPGRQVVGGEPFISFDVLADRFAFNPAFFDVTAPVSFANGEVASLPTSGLNVVVLQTLDSDGDPTTPFGAGTAANLLASPITTDGAGSFIYFNQNLDTPRLVYSTNLSDNTADLKILARLTNLEGNPGALATFTEGNFQIAAVPEPATWGMMIAGFGLVGAAMRRRRIRVAFARPA
jgi:hypothetical protein